MNYPLRFIVAWSFYVCWPRRWKDFPFCLLIALLLSHPKAASSLGEPEMVTHVASKNGFSLVEKGQAAALCIDASDYPGVIRAARDLRSDIFHVTGVTPVLKTDAVAGSLSSVGVPIVIIGTISKSHLIDRLIEEHRIDVSQISGKWESSLLQVIDRPFPGVSQALVIAGSDKRGTIFGIYGLSEQIGVSPWYWWADVRISHQDSLFVKAGRYIAPEPAVKYRGIFLNDEAPSLTGWVHETYGGYNHKFYEKVFELLLRLKANYLWPAMWGSAFNEDDPDNARLADEYGIVMGTSHHEPMLRAQQEWKRHGKGPWDYSSNAQVLENFWSEGIERNKNFESTITLGMRGDGDMPMSDGANIALLEKIVSDQREILARHQTPTLAADLKVWALYKEVQAYYEKGMRVPDDVTLLWCDDNWGNIRRLPTLEERTRSGGAGIYYHFDYVGDPRNYKWLNTNPIPKVWEQMNLALAYGADRVWIVNVGDLKPMEFPIEYFLTLARDPQRWGKDQTTEFTRKWAEREFGAEHAQEIAELVSLYTQYNGRRKPELLEPGTFSLQNYREADRIEGGWKSITARAELLEKQLPNEEQDSFYELVLFPIKASSVVNQMYIAAGRSRLYATQGRTDANDFAEQTRSLFRADALLAEEYNHTVAGGKWNHMMDQTHLGYTYWQQPPLNVMPPVSIVQPAPNARMAVAVEGAESIPGVQSLRFDSFVRQSRFIDVFNGGVAPFKFDAVAREPWILLDTRGGTIKKTTRINATVDWAKAPLGTRGGEITITQHGSSGPPLKIQVTSFNPAEPSLGSLDGFVESDGYVSIEAEHFSHMTAVGDTHWDRIPGYGATLSGMTLFPVTSPSATPGRPSPELQYRMYLFDSGEMTVRATVGPTMNFVPGRGLRFAVRFDDQPYKIVDVLEHNSDSDWSKAVSDGVRQVDVKLLLRNPGYHTLTIGMVDPGVVLEKLVVSAGAIKTSYLGPPESPRGGHSQSK